MILNLDVMSLVPQMRTARIECIYVKSGEEKKAGDKLFDLSVDLGSVFSQDYPPISYFRIVMREKAVLRLVFAAPGDVLELGSRLAIFSTGAAESMEAEPARSLRVLTASILRHDAMWTGAEP